MQRVSLYNGFPKMLGSVPQLSIDSFKSPVSHEKNNSGTKSTLLPYRAVEACLGNVRSARTGALKTCHLISGNRLRDRPS